MNEFFSDDFFCEIQTICKKTESIINQDVNKIISVYSDFKRNTIKEVEIKIKKLDDTHCKDDIKYKELLDIIKLLLNIIKYYVGE